jgi:hypothetical protein
MQFIAYVDSIVPPEWKADRPAWSSAQNDPWLLLSPEHQELADRLRSSVRHVMAEIAQEAQRSVLVDEADLGSGQV